MKTDNQFRGTIFFLLFITIVFGIYTTQTAIADNIPSDPTTAPTSGAIGGQKDMKLPETIGEEIPAPNKAQQGQATRGTSSIPEEDRNCATVEGHLRCAPRIIDEPR
jgi:hypothetical protein